MVDRSTSPITFQQEPPLGREAAGDDEQQRGQGGGCARLPDAEGRRDEHAEHEDGHTDDGDAVADAGAAVAVDVVVVISVVDDGARLELERRVHVEHGHGDRRERRLECTKLIPGMECYHERTFS